MELILIGGIVAVAAIAFIVHLTKVLRGRKPPCCTCTTCPLPESEREQCAANMDKNDAETAEDMR
jgi:hypothetical protein